MFGGWAIFAQPFKMKRASERRLVGIKNSWKYEKDF